MLKRILVCIFFSLSIPFAAASQSPPASDPQGNRLFDKLSEKALYLGMGTMLGSLSLMAELGERGCPSDLSHECHLLSRLSATLANHLFSGITHPSSFIQGVHPSIHSWHRNKTLLSQIPASTQENQRLLRFLEKRWLAKTAGVYSSMIRWICPCFGISVQIHPETSNTYARDPSNKLSETYKNRVEEWKNSLPHPHFFPLILTRPFDLSDYLPSYLEVAEIEEIQTTVERAAERGGSKVLVDVTRVFSNESNPKKWLRAWEAYRSRFTRMCIEKRLNPKEILCIQRMRKGDVGGIRILPLVAKSAHEAESLHQFLLEWVSKFGISANRIELDRWEDAHDLSNRKRDARAVLLQEKEFVSKLDFFHRKWKSESPQKTLLFEATVRVLKGLISQITEEKWEKVRHCPTRSGVAHLSFCQIEDELRFLDACGEEISFFEVASHLEQIHAHLTALLEILSPYAAADFPPIYRALLSSIPKNLKPLTSCGVHSTGMTSLSGIIKAVQNSAGRRPRVLYGENTYFENIRAFDLSTDASAIELATEEDWKEADLILGQFNPALKRIDFENTLYRVEPIAAMLHKALVGREGKPLTLALDATLDYLDSPRVANVLSEFESAIEQGALNVICYHSGIKFDLFGMDNYSGAPFFMIHSKDRSWSAFEPLLTDPVLQTDRLSLNWFCLAYSHAAPLLNLYRKQVFENARSLLNQVPARVLEDRNAAYRIIPIEKEAEPSFIDIKCYGPHHQMKASLIGGMLALKSIEAKHPLFFRPSLGFYHPNLSMLYSEDSSTIRLTVGLDPSQVEILAKCFEMMDKLNDS